MKLSVWHDKDGEWVVAESAEDAVLAYNQYIGNSKNDDGAPPEEWHALPDDKPLPVVYEDEHDMPACATDEERQALEIVRTCAEWVAINGRGYLCSTEY